MSAVVRSRSWRACAEVEGGRTVAACGRTSSASPLGSASPAVVLGVPFLAASLREGAVEGKRADQIASWGGWGSVVGRVNRGVSQREKGEGGSYRRMRDW